MKRYVIAGVVMLLVLVGWLLAGSQIKNRSQTQTPPLKNTVVMTDDKFIPNQITIKAGESVTFTNRGEDLHWPASDDHPTHQKFTEFDPKRPIKPGANWSFTFIKAGKYKYHDHIYPDITGEITVTP